jgi:glycosyltransferase involved in cell wall biosynthesis
MPRLVLAHDNIGGATGMGRVAEFIARSALDEGWELALVAANVAGDLRGSCEVIRVRAARTLPAVPQHLLWCAGAAAALARLRGDVVHVHAPALIRFADVMTCHHLAVPAREHGVRAPGAGAGAVLRRAQERAAGALDDWFYRRRPQATRMTFVSPFLRDQFERRYGAPADGTILAPPSPPWRPATADERAAARTRHGVRGDGIVVGYLGGDDVRKGVDAVRALSGAPGIELLVAGPGSERLDWPGARTLGFVDVDAFLPACDVVVAPALFDAAPTAVTQALARGVPVVVRPASGWAEAIERERAGTVWRGDGALADAVRAAHEQPRGGCERVTEAFSAARERARLLDVYAAVLAERSAGGG